MYISIYPLVHRHRYGKTNLPFADHVLEKPLFFSWFFPMFFSWFSVSWFISGCSNPPGSWYGSWPPSSGYLRGEHYGDTMGYYFFIFWRTLWRSAGFGGTLPLFYSIKIHKNPIIPWEDPHWHQQQALFSSARFGLKALLGAGFSAPPLGQWSRPGRVPWLLARSQLLRHELWTTFLANLVKLIQIEDLFFVGFTVPYSHPANNGFCSRIGCGTHALQVREKHSSLSIRLHYENPASTPQNCQTEGSWNGFSWYYILYIIAIIAIKWIFLGKSPTDLMQNMGANFPPDL